ncbi:hypothetical protein SAMN06265365_14820 [Tistlia consotensis]|uniref:Uncharacterized protein n=1 Tax=Tistlia consotensis USBA 355 TaxID=560819 RepID=A0A1Y6CYC8_9PROT|nr:hypothetical protein [Tistlia consotensis]SMF82928.1 hypothetical protein SAMN05428998_14821 [Tistlia consotensis USBA 355]SNS31384.1 hypothetical protein SAMN06265365_14820 [Tistlia consotensis]
MAKRKKAAQPTVKAGDTVLIGCPRFSLPSEWWLARVLWIDGEDLVTEHQPPSGGVQRNLTTVDQVIAVGSVEQLGHYRRRADALMSDMTGAIREAQQRIHEARRAMDQVRLEAWKKFDALAAKHAIARKREPLADVERHIVEEAAAREEEAHDD